MAIEIPTKSAKMIQCPPLPNGAITVSLSSNQPVDLYYVDSINGEEFQNTGNFKNPTSIHYKRHKVTHLNDTVSSFPDTSYIVVVNLETSMAVCNITISQYQQTIQPYLSASGYPSASGLTGASGFGISATN